MNLMQFIGNIFVVDRKINREIILSALIGTFLIALLKFIFEKQPISGNISISEIITYPLFIATIFLISSKFKIIKKFFIGNFKLLVIIYLIPLILIIIPFIFIRPIEYFYLLTLLFFISGFQRIVIQKTKALFFAEIPEFMDFIQVYGYIRASFFGFGILWFSTIIVLKSEIVWIIFFSMVLIIQIQFLANLYPYCRKHTDIETTILILRKIAEYKNIKINELVSLINVSDNLIKKQLNRLILANYISLENGHIKLKDEYQKIYDGKL